MFMFHNCQQNISIPAYCTILHLNWLVKSCIAVIYVHKTHKNFSSVLFCSGSLGETD